MSDDNTTPMTDDASDEESIRSTTIIPLQSQNDFFPCREQLPERSFSVRGGDFAISPDASFIAAEEQENILCIIDVEQSRIVQRIRTHVPMPDMVFSPDNRLLGISDGAVDLAILDCEKEETIFSASEEGVARVTTFSPDSSQALLAVGDLYANLLVFTVGNREAVYHFRSEAHSPRYAFYAKDSSFTVHVWDTICDGRDKEFATIIDRKGHQVARIMLPSINDTALAPDNSILALCAAPRQQPCAALTLVDTKTGFITAAVSMNEEARSVAFTEPETVYVATESSLCCFSAPEGKLLSETQELRHPVCASPDGRLLAALNSEGTPVIRRPNGATRALATDHEGPITSMFFNLYGTKLITRSEKLCLISDVRTGEPLFRLDIR